MHADRLLISPSFWKLGPLNFSPLIAQSAFVFWLIHDQFDILNFEHNSTKKLFAQQDDGQN